MFTIILQKNNSEDNKINKDLTNVLTLEGVLKNETSILNPSFLINGTENDIIGCNYLTVDTFNRSYFITNITTVRTGLIEISCRVDVLESFKDEILECSAIVKRQENNWNLYLNDGSFKVYQNPMILTKAFPSGFTTMQYVLAVAGG